MTDLTCQLCGLCVPGAAREAVQGIEHCPRCLAQSGGSVALVERSAARNRATRSRAVEAWRRLPTAPGR